METNSQSSTQVQRSEAIVIDRRFGKRSDAVRKNISLGVKRYMRHSPSEVSTLYSKLREERLGKPRLDLRGRTGPTSSKRPGVSSWEIVKLRASGASLPTTAKECGMKLSGVDFRTQALGLPRYRSLYDFEPFVGRHARRLWRASGLTHSEFAGQVGVSSRNLQADVTPKHLGMHIDPERAGKYLAWRDRAVQVLLAEAPGERGKRVRWGRSSVLKTFFPDLRAMRGLLVGTLPEIAGYLSAHANADANELGEWICDQAQAETARSPRTLRWRKLLPWLPKLVSTLMTNLDLLRRTSDQGGAAPHLWKVALSVLADYLAVSPATLQRAMEQKTRQIAPGMMCQLIERAIAPTNGTLNLSQRVSGARAPKLPVKKRGRQQGATIGDTAEQIVVAAGCRLRGMKLISEMAPELYPRQRKSKRHAKDATKKFLRRHAADIAREEANLAALPEAERMATVNGAKQKLSQKAHE